MSREDHPEGSIAGAAVVRPAIARTSSTAHQTRTHVSLRNCISSRTPMTLIGGSPDGLQSEATCVPDGCEAFGFNYLARTAGGETRIATHLLSNYYSMGTLDIGSYCRNGPVHLIARIERFVGIHDRLAGLFRRTRPGMRRRPCMLVTPGVCAS